MDIVRTQRAELRRFTLADLPAMRELEAEPLIMRFTPMRVPQTPAQTETRLRNLLEKTATYAPYGVWAAEARDDRRFLGWFMLLRTDLEYPELGFMLVKRAWGQGFASEISGRLVELAFDTLGAAGVMARTDADNLASIRVLEKVGFRLRDSKTSFDRALGREVVTRIFAQRKTSPV